jgi:uncharacterized protein YndB with AHSA1/START domain
MQKITTEIIVSASLQKAWSAYTEPESIKSWAFAGDDWEAPYAENDLKVGGRFLTRMSAKDKSSSFDFTGTYSEVVEFKKIIYQMDKAPEDSKNRECEVIFLDLGNNQIKVTVTFDSEDQNPVDMQKVGWQSILNNFKKFVENN